MTAAWSWTPHDAAATLMIGMMTLTYVGFHYGLAADRFRRTLGKRFGPEVVEIGSVLRQRVYGGLLLGLVPAVAVWLGLGLSPLALGLRPGNPFAAFAWFCGLAVILVPVLRQAAKKPSHWLTYPQMRLVEWSRGLWWQNVLGWGVYLLGYEYFFRGVMLSYFVDLGGVWPGILLTTALYTYAHLPKDAGECVGSALMGVLFAVMALQTGAIWAPFAVHWLIATCGETFAIQANPTLVWEVKSAAESGDRATFR